MERSVVPPAWCVPWLSTSWPTWRKLADLEMRAAAHTGALQAAPALHGRARGTTRRAAARSSSLRVRAVANETTVRCPLFHCQRVSIAPPPPTHRGVRTARVTETRVPPPHAHSPHPHAVPGVVAWAVSMGHVAATHLSQLWLLAGRLGGCGWCRSRCGCGEAGRVRLGAGSGRARRQTPGAIDCGGEEPSHTELREHTVRMVRLMGGLSGRR